MAEICDADVLDSVEQIRITQTIKCLVSRTMQRKMEASIGFINNDSEATIIDSEVHCACAFLKSCALPYKNSTASAGQHLEPHQTNQTSFFP